MPPALGRTALAIAVALAMAGPGCAERHRAGGAVPAEALALGPGATSVEALAARADSAFRGTIVESWVEIDAATRLPFTYVRAHVDEGLKGAHAGTEVVWRVLGGEVAGRTVTLHDAPEFAVGEQAYWLLRQGDAGWPLLVGLGRGKWTPDGRGGVASAGGTMPEAAFRAAVGAR